MTEQPRTFTAPVSGRYHVVSGQEPHLAQDCTETCSIQSLVGTGGSVKTFAENWPAAREIIAATGQTAAEAKAAGDQALSMLNSARQGEGAA
jgi:hypothetical protein